MLQVCPSCNAENRDIAKFCDQCGMSLTPDAVRAAGPDSAIPAQAPARPSINWAALLFVLAIVLFFVWLLRSPEQAQPPTPASNPAQVMGDIQEQLKQLKERLDKDPADTEAISQMYLLYGQIGQSDKVRPYVDRAVAALLKQVEDKKTDSESAIGLLADVAQAAASAGDIAGSIVALEGLYTLKKDPKVLWFIGNLYYDNKEPRKAVDAYDRYLAVAKPGVDGDYWNARVDRATMLLELHKVDKSPEHLEEALAELESVTKERQDMWSAWFNLGHAWLQKGDKVRARQAFEMALGKATDDLLRWRAEEELALLDGREPPPMPNPHGEGMAMEGVENPHGGASVAGP